MRLAELIHSGNFVRIMEMFPPGLPSPDLVSDSQKYDLSFRFDKLTEGISKLESLADAFSLPELKDAQRVHLNSVGVASELKHRTGNDVIPTITLRDSNRQAILGLVAYALWAGIENILFVRGDPYEKGKKESPKNVYDMKKVSSLVSSVRKLEEHLSTQEKLCVITPINLAKTKSVGYLDIVKEREESGVDIFFAEQMFEQIDSYVERIDVVRKMGITSPIVHNVFPLKSYDDGVKCIEKFGWSISAGELHRLKTEGPSFGLEMARRRYHFLVDRKDKVEGACISTRGDPEMARLVTS